MDPRLLDTLWEVYQKTGSRKPIHVVSSYRSPKTNAMLRRTRGGQAKKSQHMVGRAIDFFIPGQSAKKVRELGLKAQSGGVGYYPKSGFVHLDTGRVRHWPRMSRSQLVKVFPKGGTLHVPSDGKALPGYKLAQADYKKRMANGGSTALRGVRGRGVSGGGGLLAGLFRGNGDNDAGGDATATKGKSPVADAAPEVIASLPRRGPQAQARTRPQIRTVSPDEIDPPLVTPAEVPEAATETLVAGLPDFAPTPSFRPGAVRGERTVEPTVETVIADAAAAGPRPVIRATDAGATAIASASQLPSFATGYAPSPSERPAARALARIGGASVEDVARRSLAREGELLAAIGRTTGRLGSADTPSSVVPDAAAKPALTENALRLAFARSTSNVAARRGQLMAKLAEAEAPRRPLAAPTVKAAATSITPARPRVADIDPDKINALAAALRKQATQY